MLKTFAFAALATLAIGSAHAADDFAKRATDATQPLQLNLAPDGSPTPSDLTLDTNFSATGMRALWAPNQDGWSNTEDGVGVFPWDGVGTLPGPPPVTTNVHKGYYVVGKQKNTAGDAWRVWITRVDLGGITDTTFGTDGWIYGGAQGEIVDVIVSRPYAFILSNMSAGAATRVACIDLSTPTGNSCFTGFAGLLTWGVSASGPRTAAYGQRLIYDARYGLFVAARIMNTTRGQEVGVARISAGSGALIPQFNGDGYYFGLPAWAPASGAEVKVNALAVTPYGYAGTPHLYVGGQMKRDVAGDHDGFILGLAPATGVVSPDWDWRAFYYENDNTGYKKDAITALAPLRNGKVAFAGWSETDDANHRPMIMGRVNSNGGFDANFCKGNSNRGPYGCMVEHNIDEFYKPDSQPVALAERAQNRDLVVAMRSKNNGSMPPTNVITRMEQYSADGNRVHAALDVDYAGGAGVTRWSRPFGMWMGHTGQWIGGVDGTGEEVIAVVGTRLYSGTDFDATLIHLKATDSIFADAFGGGGGD